MIWEPLNNRLDYYRRAVEADPNFIVAYHNLGAMLNDQGRLTEARECFTRAQSIRSDDLIRVTLATALPPVYGSREEMRNCREQLEHNVRQLIADRVTIDTTQTIVPNMFYAAYHGRNDCQLQRDMARIYQSPAQLVCPPRRRTRPAGCASGSYPKYFCDHTIGRMTVGLVTQLSRQKFEVAVIGPPSPERPAGRRFSSVMRSISSQLPLTAGPMCGTARD